MLWLFNMLNDIGIRGEKQPICHIFDRANPDEAEANAQLIASAPDLLEASKQAQEYIYGSCRSTPEGKLRQILERLTKALAKAEGK